MDLKTLLAKDVSDVKVEYNGHVVLMSYDAAALTPELEAQVRAADDSGTEEVAAMMAALVRSWDLEESEGVPLPVGIEAMRKLPVKFLAEALSTITKDLMGDPSLGVTSVAS